MTRRERIAEVGCIAVTVAAWVLLVAVLLWVLP